MNNYNQKYNGYGYGIPQVNKQSQGIFAQIKSSSAFNERISDYKLPFQILLVIYRILTVVFILLKNILLLPIKFIKWVGSLENKWPTIIAIASIIFLIFFIDFIAFFGKVYPGVKVEGIELGGKTKEQATEIIESILPERINSHSIVVYASEEAQNAGINNEDMSYVNEQISRAQQLSQTQYWEKSPTDLGTSLDTDKTIDDALNETRGITNIFKRLAALFGGVDQKATAKFDGDQVDYFNDEINQKLGVKMVNPNVKMDGENAIVTAGIDGEQVFREDLVYDLSNVVFIADPEKRNFVADVKKTPQQISTECAQDLANKLNVLTQSTVTFSYYGTTEQVPRADLCSWIGTEITEETFKNSGGCSCAKKDDVSTYCIQAVIEKTVLNESLLNSGKIHSTETDQIVVGFEKSGDDISVTTNGQGKIPNYDKVVEQLEEQLLYEAVSYQSDFNNNNSNSKKTDYSDLKKDSVSIKVETSPIPEKLTYDQAVKMGVIDVFASYTTTYTTGAGTENRNHNIELVSQLLNNSICKGNGGQWSYHDTAGGECNEAKGFLPAGSVVGNGYSESVGGGICQVATTIFNAVYDSGLPIVSRSPHNLYIASYPAGRDAAVSYPSPDLIWQNDQPSDCLVRVVCSGSSVKCSLIGVNPHYTVESDTGQWEEGDKYTTEIVVDPSKEPNSKFTQTTGADGRKITIVRKVYDKNHNLIRDSKIASTYLPKTEIIVIGPGDEANKLLEAKQARMKKETDKW